MRLEVIIIVIFENDITRENAYKLRDIKEGEIIPLVSDVMFHTMLNNSKRKKYVSYLLSLILEEDYEEILNNIEFVKDELDKENFYDSKRTVDLVCRIKEKIYNIEMNNNSDIRSLERNISYLNDLYKSSMKVGSDYNYNYCIQININNFNIKGNKKKISRFKLRDEEGDILTNKIDFIYIYLPLIKEAWYTNSELSELEKLLLIFNEDSRKEVDKIMKGNKIMEEYRREAECASNDTEIIGLYDKEKTREILQQMALEDEKKKAIKQGLEQGLEQGIKQGREEGMKQGIEQQKISIINNMKKLNLDEDTIIKSLDISQEEYNELLKNKNLIIFLIYLNKEKTIL